MNQAQRNMVEEELARAAEEALRTAGRIRTPHGETVEVVDPPTAARIGLRFDWETICRMAKAEAGEDLELPADILDAARRHLTNVVEAELDRLETLEREASDGR